jgi:hypothetical protein
MPIQGMRWKFRLYLSILGHPYNNLLIILAEMAPNLRSPDLYLNIILITFSCLYLYKEANKCFIHSPQGTFLVMLGIQDTK